MDEYADKEMVYTTFVDTYKITSFLMGVGMVYPSPGTETRRIVCILLYIISAVPLSIMILIDMYDSWMRRDIINIIRHSTIVGPFVGGISKMLMMLYKRKSGQYIIEEIDSDYSAYNSLPHSYKIAINKHIQNSKTYSELCWTFIVVICVMSFPFIAVILNLYNFVFKSEPSKHMIHDLVIPFLPPERRFDSPFFEILFVYEFYASLLFIVNFAGYDAFFGICINHACLKMELFCKGIEDALKGTSEIDIYMKIVRVIHEQNRLKRYVYLIQDTFNIWLGLILVAEMIQIGSGMYHITEGHEFDLRYVVCITGTTILIYTPCRYSAKLKDMSVETATVIYSAGWENVQSIRIQKTILLMIFKSQTPFEVTAFNFFTFDMDLFVRILNSSYSMYTLLRS